MVMVMVLLGLNSGGDLAMVVHYGQTLLFCSTSLTILLLLALLAVVTVLFSKVIYDIGLVATSA